MSPRKRNVSDELAAYWAGDRSPASRAANATYCREQRKQNPSWIKRMNLGKYGLSLHDFQRMLSDQDGRCAICRELPTQRNQYGLNDLAVDHDHETGKVRGLLCHNCNRGLGLLGDDPSRLRSAADYLRGQ